MFEIENRVFFSTTRRTLDEKKSFVADNKLKSSSVFIAIIILSQLLMYNLSGLEAVLAPSNKSMVIPIGSTAASQPPPSPAISCAADNDQEVSIPPPLSIDNHQQSPPLNIVVIHGDPSKPNDILPGGKWDEDDFYTLRRTKEALAQLPQYRFTYLCSHDTMIDDLRRLKQSNSCDLVLQLCDEGWMNNSRMELHVTALLEMLDLPYTGVGPKTIGITYDKQGVLKIAESIGVPVPRSVYIDEGGEEHLDPTQLGLEFPVIVKPNSTDGSFGITAKSVCNSVEEVQAAIASIRNVFYVQGPVLMQEYLTGRDVNVGVMERENPETGSIEPWVLPITEEDYSALPEDLPKICGFESKWDESSPYFKISTRPTTLSESAQQKIREYTLRLFRRIECRDYARFDWRLDGRGQPRLLEANPNCGWCWDGHLPKTAALCHIDYSQFFEMIIKSALDRAKRNQLLKEQSKSKKFIIVGRGDSDAPN